MTTERTGDGPAAAGRGADEFGFATRAVHAGARPEPYTGARAVPIFQTTSYVFEDPDAAAAYFDLQEYGNTYSRIMNPTVAAFEERVASLEGAIGAVAFSSGLAAQAAALFTILRPGDHLVASRALYGGTLTQLRHLERKLGFSVTFVDPDDPENFRNAVREETRLLFGETIGNPGGNVLDLERVAAAARERGIPLMVDSTFATPYLCRPLEWGADLVVHSATKFIGGHGTSIGGVVAESGRFDWANGKFPSVAEPSPAYHGLALPRDFRRVRVLDETAGGDAARPRRGDVAVQRLPVPPGARDPAAADGAAYGERAPGGGVSSPGGPKSLPVAHPGLASSRYAPLVRKYLPKGAGAVFSFDLRGGRAAGRRFIGGLSLFSHLANVGDAKSLVIHPASTTHRQLTGEELAGAGISPGTIRPLGGDRGRGRPAAGPRRRPPRRRRRECAGAADRAAGRRSRMSDLTPAAASSEVACELPPPAAAPSRWQSPERIAGCSPGRRRWRWWGSPRRNSGGVTSSPSTCSGTGTGSSR